MRPLEWNAGRPGEWEGASSTGVCVRRRRFFCVLFWPPFFACRLSACRAASLCALGVWRGFGLLSSLLPAPCRPCIFVDKSSLHSSVGLVLCHCCCRQHDWMDHTEGGPTELSGGKAHGCPLNSFKFKVCTYWFSFVALTAVLLLFVVVAGDRLSLFLLAVAQPHSPGQRACPLKQERALHLRRGTVVLGELVVETQKPTLYALIPPSPPFPKKQKTGEKPSTNGHPAYQNPRTHWWDVSFVYGSDEETLRRTRTYEGGKIYAGEGGVMPHNPDGTIVTGDNKNSWVGVSLLQCLFAMEHNSIAEEMAAAHPAWSGEVFCSFGTVCWRLLDLF